MNEKSFLPESQVSKSVFDLSNQIDTNDFNYMDKNTRVNRTSTSDIDFLDQIKKLSNRNIFLENKLKSLIESTKVERSQSTKQSTTASIALLGASRKIDYLKSEVEKLNQTNISLKDYSFKLESKLLKLSQHSKSNFAISNASKTVKADESFFNKLPDPNKSASSELEPFVSVRSSKINNIRNKVSDQHSSSLDQVPLIKLNKSNMPKRLTANKPSIHRSTISKTDIHNSTPKINISEANSARPSTQILLDPNSFKNDNILFLSDSLKTLDEYLTKTEQILNDSNAFIDFDDFGSNTSIEEVNNFIKS